MNTSDTNMNRRAFLTAGASLAALAAGRAATAAEPAKPDAPVKPAKLIATAPALQNAAETSMGVAFAVKADASGWVEYSESPDLANAKRAYSGGLGMMTVDGKMAQIRLTGLKPATKYYYRIGADAIYYKTGYEMKNLGPEVDETIHSFTTLGAAATGSFCIINDTHESGEALHAVFSKLDELNPSVVVWNGDASNTTETIDRAISIFLAPSGRHPGFSADRPYMFINGNHDFRGRFNRRLGDVVMYRETSERSGEFADLGRNFVQRLGDVCLIGLDTGEDKVDTNPVFAGIFQMQAYREKQARWLAEAIESPAVKTAKWKIACCHIPLFDSNPKANPGDILPDDGGGSASWQRTCAKLWGPSLAKAGVNLVVTAHMHRHRYDAPTADRPWGHLVGGGCEFGGHYRTIGGKRTFVPRKDLFPTVIEGKVEDGRLVVRVHDLHNKRLANTLTFG